MSEQIITGWKAIVEYTGAAKNTIRRWEREAGFPLRRIMARGMVFIYPAEVDLWRKARDAPLTKIDQN